MNFYNKNGFFEALSFNPRNLEDYKDADHKIDFKNTHDLYNYQLYMILYIILIVRIRIQVFSRVVTGQSQTRIGNHEISEISEYLRLLHSLFSLVFVV